MHTIRWACVHGLLLYGFTILINISVVYFNVYERRLQMNTFLFEETRKKLPSYLEERRKMLKLKQCKEIATTRTGYTITLLCIPSNALYCWYVQYFQKVMSQKFNFYNTKYTGMRHHGATLIFRNTVLSLLLWMSFQIRQESMRSNGKL